MINNHIAVCRPKRVGDAAQQQRYEQAGDIGERRHGHHHARLARQHFIALGAQDRIPARRAEVDHGDEHIL